MEGGIQYGLLGAKLGHSLSPEIHQRLGGYDYALLECTPEEMGRLLREGEFLGLNVTIPYKTRALEYCHHLTPIAQRIGSVNTIVRQPDGTLLGDNTDYEGATYVLEPSASNMRGKKVVILGTGGAALAVKAALEDLGAGEVVMISRNGPHNYHNLNLHQDAVCLVNGTPVGMYPNTDAAPLSLQSFPQCTHLLDLIYYPCRTRLIQEGIERGIQVENGMRMLVAQARGAVNRFLGRHIGDDQVEAVAAQIQQESKHIMLIGMPGCGKSTLGAELARQLGRCWVDLDQVVERKAGQTVPQILDQYGEEAFRRLEHRALQEISQEKHLVVSCGGGVVTWKENIPLLQEHATVLYIRRPLEQLATDHRPISQREGLEKLYHQRAPLYEALADDSLDNDQRIEEVARGWIARWRLESCWCSMDPI